MSKFKNGSGQLYLKELFFEMTTNPTKENVLFTLKEEDYKGYPSLKRLYMSYADSDPTEYSFVVDHLYSWHHWERLCQSAWFKDYVSAWRFEKDLHIKSKALARVMKEAEEGGKNSLTANRYLIEKNFIETNAEKKSVGRPSKEAIKYEAQILFERDREVDLDYQRTLGNGELN